ERVERHLSLCDWLLSRSNEDASCGTIASLLDELTPGAWYSVMEFIDYALQRNEDNDVPVLRSAGGHWHYVTPSASMSSRRGLARSLEETLPWLGLVDRAECEGESVFRITELGALILRGVDINAARKLFPPHKSELVVQPNFDIVVDMKAADPLITVPLDQFCERVSASQVAVYHLTKESFTRAVQQGRNSAAFIEFLLAHNKGKSLPRNVLTTIEGWRGGMKRVRLRTVQVLEAEDPLVMADVRHRKRVAKHVDPIETERMVVLKKARKSELKKLLEKEGFVVE
ncbi:MAG: helicase-associated domain-containing protein, partial [Candidatus Hydrogenedentes bacterium]|nr:helicase-associated domain-containing protein [Candidatus Hydrogenedentota bacterium]